MKIKYKSRITWDNEDNVFRYKPTDRDGDFDLEDLESFTEEVLLYYPELKDIVSNNECYIIQAQGLEAVYQTRWNDDLNSEFDEIGNFMDDEGMTIYPPSNMIAYEVNVYDGLAECIIFDKRFEKLVNEKL